MKLQALVVTALLLLLAVPVVAQSYSFGYYAAFGTKIACWSDPNATLGFDGEELADLSTDYPVKVAIYKKAGVEGWNGNDGFYRSDLRAPISPGQKIVIDNIYLWALPGTSQQPLDLYGPTSLILPPGLTYRLFLTAVPSTIYYNGPGVWTETFAKISLPFYSSSDGLSGYRFRLEMTAVPEPSSLLALVGGLAAVRGNLLRRRRSDP